MGVPHRVERLRLGRSDARKILRNGNGTRSKKTGAMRISHKGVSVIGDERGAVAFLNPTTAIAGPVNAIKKALDERNSNTGVPDAARTARP